MTLTVGMMSVMLCKNSEKQPKFQRHRYWVRERFFETLMDKYKHSRKWLFAYRDVARSTDERTVIALAIPREPASIKLPLMLFGKRLRARTARRATLVGKSSILSY